MICFVNELKNSYEFSTTPTGVTVFFTVPSELSYLKGHFPGNPILPAVGIIDLSLFFLTLPNQTPPYRLSKMLSMKVKSPITPNERIVVDGQKLEDGNWLVLWKRQADEMIVAELEMQISS